MTTMTRPGAAAGADAQQRAGGHLRGGRRRHRRHVRRRVRVGRHVYGRQRQVRHSLRAVFGAQTVSCLGQVLAVMA